MRMSRAQAAPLPRGQRVQVATFETQASRAHSCPFGQQSEQRAR
jgi:hypothetical protein